MHGLVGFVVKSSKHIASLRGRLKNKFRKKTQLRHELPVSKVWCLLSMWREKRLSFEICTGEKKMTTRIEKRSTFVSFVFFLFECACARQNVIKRKGGRWKIPTAYRGLCLFTGVSLTAGIFVSRSICEPYSNRFSCLLEENTGAGWPFIATEFYCPCCCLVSKLSREVNGVIDAAGTK